MHHKSAVAVAVAALLLCLGNNAFGASLFDNDDVPLEIQPWELQGCEIYRDEKLHAVVDEICLRCHEMFSHDFPDLRADCRANCFKNVRFTTCLSLFRPVLNTDLERYLDTDSSGSHFHQMDDHQFS
ncbi:Uncharacterized protein T02_12235 [Trichinella nativa]|uniref:Uncharacterized protein n=1 Tax=Trichinella nativa TaxID=6335 RepID=A0A0V1L370_9BILA|nr:Uncharacterized protein T06_731 [Trichinella sp. T6]KRZ53749.1 Uncharacterized protein T02_12235 [Trichinella nativa]OUC39837.1 hypothetical protein D917_04568 [Trichinella nativa]